MIKRKKPLNRIGRKTQEWIDARKRLKKLYAKKGIIACEIRMPGCIYDNFLSFAHRYKRSDPRCKHTFKQTLLACQSCHVSIEGIEDLTTHYFKKLRS